MRVGLLGDTHGSPFTVISKLDYFQNEGVTKILQVGDFGFWPGRRGKKFLEHVKNDLDKRGMMIYVTPGNHEDYDYINGLSTFSDGWKYATSNIAVAPRGHRWEWEGVSFVSLGGAPSVDRAWRLEENKRSYFPVWWAAEDITGEDIQKTISGGSADVMIAHDAPYGIPSLESALGPSLWTKEDLEYSFQGRLKMLSAVEGVSPKLFFHGHYHFRVDDVLHLFNGAGEVRALVKTYGLASDLQKDACGILDLDDLSFKFQ